MRLRSSSIETPNRYSRAAVTVSRHCEGFVNHRSTYKGEYINAPHEPPHRTRERLAAELSGQNGRLFERPTVCCPIRRGILLTTQLEWIAMNELKRGGPGWAKLHWCCDEDVVGEGEVRR